MLSTGSKRKVWLAAAFASGAAVTLLDDPLAELDGRRRRRWCWKRDGAVVYLSPR